MYNFTIRRGAGNDVAAMPNSCAISVDGCEIARLKRRPRDGSSGTHSPSPLDIDFLAKYIMIRPVVRPSPFLCTHDVYRNVLPYIALDVACRSLNGCAFVHQLSCLPVSYFSFC